MGNELFDGVPRETRGRPIIDSGDLEANVVAVNIDGRVITWCDGSWAGDRGLIVEAKWKSMAGVRVALTYGGDTIMADSNIPLGALAAMVAINPGRARILLAPVSANTYWVPLDSGNQ